MTQHITTRRSECLRYAHYILVAVAAVSFSGCSIPTERTNTEYVNQALTFEAEHKRRIGEVEVASVEVPLPKTTPYDADAAAREVYLKWYPDGYRNGLAGYLSSCCLEDRPNRKAAIDGWYDGQSAGLDISSKKTFRFTPRDSSP
jgi:hypothetical protein